MTTPLTEMLWRLIPFAAKNRGAFECRDMPIGKTCLHSSIFNFTKRVIPWATKSNLIILLHICPKLCGAPPITTLLTEDDWENAYQALWAVRDHGIRSDFPFVEPNDYESIIADAPEPPALQPLSDEEYAERIKGAWYGRIGGVVLGKPLELHVDRKFIKRYLKSLDAYPLDDWVPYESPALGITLRSKPSTLGNIHYVEPDDDIHYTILGLMLLEEHGFHFTNLDVANNHLRNIPYHWLWSCTRQSYYHMVNLRDDRPVDEQIDEFPTKINPWREGINTAIRADFWGYIAPSDPQTGRPHRSS